MAEHGTSIESHRGDEEVAGQGSQPLIDFKLLPGQLKLIARQCGEDCMWAVWRCYGGGHLSVPSALDEFHPLAVTLSLDYAQRLVVHFSPKTLYIAKGDGAQQAARLGLRNRAIIEERRQGRGLSIIARKYDLSNRQVINILNAHAEPNPNADIFEL